MEFSKELKELFLKGGAVVCSETYTTNTYLIRMPKGEFIKDNRIKYEDNFFEYVIVDDNYEIASYFSGSLVDAKKTMRNIHKEKCSYIWRKEYK